MNDPIDTLIELFYSSRDDLGKFSSIEADELSDQYRSLLAHHDHMTVTLEAWHNSLVEIRVLEERCDRERYARRIVLARQRDGVPVQFGPATTCWCRSRAWRRMPGSSCGRT